MTKPFAAVLAELQQPETLRLHMGELTPDEVRIAQGAVRFAHSRLSIAHAAELAERDAIAEGYMVSRNAYEQDVVQLQARAEAAERDARRWQAMREHMVAVDWKPEMGGGPVVMFECMAERVLAGPEGADAIADAAVEFAAIATTEGAP